MKKKGFTLIEVMVAIFLLGITSVSGFEFFRYCHRFIVEANVRFRAANLGRETMETIYWDPNITTGATDLLPTDDTRFKDPFTQRNYTVTINSTGDYRILTVTVD